jgi:hypothetical protein
MITMFEAIRALNPTITTLIQEDAFDVDHNPVKYDKAAAEAKLAELQAAEDAKKTAALAKLTALGLTTADLTALGL